MHAKGRAQDVNGEKNKQAKLSPVDVVKIRADNRPPLEIAKDFGVHRAHISLIKRNKAWRHI